jgi:hypothetical protein
VRARVCPRRAACTCAACAACVRACVTCEACAACAECAACAAPMHREGGGDVGETQAHRSVGPCVSRSAGIAKRSHETEASGRPRPALVRAPNPHF